MLTSFTVSRRIWFAAAPSVTRRKPENHVSDNLSERSESNEFTVCQCAFSHPYLSLTVAAA